MNTNNENHNLLRGLLSSSLYPNIAKISLAENCITKDGSAFIHPSSMIFKKGHNFSNSYLVYQEKFQTSKVFVKEISLVSSLLLAMFAGTNINLKYSNKTYYISLDDKWIKFPVESFRVNHS